jgi:hypothetical protein
MSPEDALSSLGHDYQRDVIRLIEKQARSASDIQALIACLAADIPQRVTAIRDYFQTENRDDSRG